MRRKDTPPVHSAGRGRSLISIRSNQPQQRKMIPASRTLLPRSYSSPSTRRDQESAPQSPLPSQRSYVMRSFSTPEPKAIEYRRNSDSFYRPKTHGSRGELDSDLESFEQFEDSFVDMDDDQEQNVYGTYSRSPEKEEPKRVMATLLQGSGLQRISIRPVSSCTTQTLYNAREAMKELQRNQQKARLNFRPLTNLPHSDHDQEEELLSSPQLDLDTAEMDQQLRSEQQLMERGAAMAMEESDGDTLDLNTAEMDQQLRSEQQLMERGAAMAMEESDGDTVSLSLMITPLTTNKRKSSSSQLDLDRAEMDQLLRSEQQLMERGAAMTMKGSDGDTRSARFRSLRQKYRRVRAATLSLIREPAPPPTRPNDRPTEPTPADRVNATCARPDMGNVQCCASGRFYEGKKTKSRRNRRRISRKESVRRIITLLVVNPVRIVK
ncbi:uncharacterized protein LOC125228053 [Leguminivora glycinivorella]|uniref:uncharacterized protein LOC125228053 n=1 Tax=Leguminivora glycinivorella TaxID=1035111 RepID=UPI00200FE337|nr:uncharacterized protein LOC125228053 [Leguminivora glycinivorella]